MNWGLGGKSSRRKILRSGYRLSQKSCPIRPGGRSWRRKILRSSYRLSQKSCPITPGGKSWRRKILRSYYRLSQKSCPIMSLCISKCPKIHRKSVLRLLRYFANLYLYRFALILGHSVYNDINKTLLVQLVIWSTFSVYNSCVHKFMNMFIYDS